MKLRIILPGGGFKGIFQVGFLDELMAQTEVEIDHVYGTSIGALIAPFVAAQRLDLPLKLLNQMNKREDVFETWFWSRWAPSCCQNWVDFYHLLTKQGLYRRLKMNLFHDLLDEMSPEETKQYRDKCSVVSVKVDERQECWHSGADLAFGVEASSRLWGGLPPLKHQGQLYSDGGLTELYPISQVWANNQFLDPDFDGLYLVLDFQCNDNSINRFPNTNIFYYLMNLLSTATRHLVTAETQNFLNQDNVYRFTMCQPHFENSLDFTPELRDAALQEGRRQAHQFLQVLNLIEHPPLVNTNLEETVIDAVPLLQRVAL